MFAEQQVAGDHLQRADGRDDEHDSERLRRRKRRCGSESNGERQRSFGRAIIGLAQSLLGVRLNARQPESLCAKRGKLFHLTEYEELV